MNNKYKALNIILILLVLTFIGYNALKKDDLKEATWEKPEEILAITIDGEEVNSFPTTANYETSVTCSTGNGEAVWNGSKWTFNASSISKNKTKCNVAFTKAAPAPKGWYTSKNGTLLYALKNTNPVKVGEPLTTPGLQLSGYTMADAYTFTYAVASKYSSKAIIYGTGVSKNSDGTYNLTGVTSGTYSSVYSSLAGKYLPTIYVRKFRDASTTNISSIIQVVSATSTSISVKVYSSEIDQQESVLAATEDDYGTSYYYRGLNSNNYVKFANKCWRIVRITGDGSIKIVLHNDNTGNYSNPCSSSYNSESAAFAKYSGTTYNSAFNAGTSDNAALGFMFGVRGASSYAAAHANTNKSTILTNLETWYKKGMTSYTNKLADVIWCNDKSTYRSGEGVSTTTNLGYGQNNSKYGAYHRLKAEDSYVPGGTGASLVCPNDNLGGKLSKFTVSDTTNGNGNLTYKVGLLTADEVAFAGAKWGEQISALTYLVENATAAESESENEGNGKNSYYLLSPGVYSGPTYHFYSNALGGFGGIMLQAEIGVRPAVALLSTTEVTGSGTSSDPYVVK